MTSRYAGCEVGIDAHGRQYLAKRHKPSIGERVDDRIHECTEGDTLYGIAHAYLGNAELWWVVADFNRIRDPLTTLEAGQLIRLPSIERLQEVLNA